MKKIKFENLGKKILKLDTYRRITPVYYKYTARNGKIQLYVTAYARHVFLNPVQEYRHSSVAAGAYGNGSEMTGDMIWYDFNSITSQPKGRIASYKQTRK